MFVFEFSSSARGRAQDFRHVQSKAVHSSVCGICYPCGKRLKRSASDSVGERPTFVECEILIVVSGKPRDSAEACESRTVTSELRRVSKIAITYENARLISQGNVLAAAVHLPRHRAAGLGCDAEIARYL